MKSKTLKLTKGFRIAFANARAQAAEMVIPVGDSEGGPGNEHRAADQWLFVLDGKGVAVVGGRRVALRSGTLLLIEKGEEHEIRNTGRAHLRTLVLYAPPAYTQTGARLSRGRP